MGDVGDYWNESRKERREARALWLQCACGRKVSPGVPCPDCGRMEDPERAHSKAKRASNREHSARILREAGIAFDARNDGAHLIVSAPGLGFIDFWPGTGLWRTRGPNTVDGRGVRLLVRAVEAQQVTR